MTSHLLGVREIATILGVSRQRADQLSRSKGFPEPVADLASGRIWDARAVEAWAKARRRPPQDVVEEELSLLPKGSDAGPLSVYRLIYSVTRQQGLGRRPRGVPPTRRFAHEQAFEEARKLDPKFEVILPAGWLDEA